MKRSRNEALEGEVVIKARLGSDIRRFQLPREGGFDALLALLNQIYDSLPANCFVKYKDDEGDLVSVTSDDELDEALRLAAEQSSKVLYLSLFPLSSRPSDASATRGAAPVDAAADGAPENTRTALVRTLSQEFAEQLEQLTRRTAELCLAAAAPTVNAAEVSAANHEATATTCTTTSTAIPPSDTASSASYASTDVVSAAEAALGNSSLASLEQEISAQLIDQLNALALDAHPDKREYRYDICRSSTLEPTTEAGRRDAFTRLTMDSVKRAKFEKAIEEAADKMLEHELQKLQESKAPRRRKKQRAKLCPSCPRCSEPMSEREPPPDAAAVAADPLAAYQCTSTTCSFSQPAKAKMVYVYHHFW